MSTHPFRTQVMKHFSDSYEKVRSVSVDREFLRKKTFLIVINLLSFLLGCYILMFGLSNNKNINIGIMFYNAFMIAWIMYKSISINIESKKTMVEIN